MRIGIIDSGVNSDVLNSKVFQNCFLEGRESIYSDLNGHGTMTAKLIEDFSQRNIEIISAKIFDVRLHTTLKSLYFALEYFLNKNVDIINLSLSVSMNSIHKEIERVCKKIINHGTKIIVSYANKTNKTALDQVDGIIAVYGNIFHDTKRYWYNDAKRKAVADKSPLLVSYDKNKFRFYNGNSKATAIFTSHMVNCFDEKKCEFNINKLILDAQRNVWCKDDIWGYDIVIPEGRVNGEESNLETWINIDDILKEVFDVSCISILHEYYWTHPLLAIDGNKAYQLISLVEQKYNYKFNRRELFLNDFLDYVSFMKLVQKNMS